MKMEVFDVRKQVDGWRGTGWLTDEATSRRTKTRVTIRLSEQGAKECMDGILKGAPRTVPFGETEVLEATSD
jgi:hypothetical protein